MIDDSTKKDIDQISLDVLKQSKALDVFPTPIDKIIQCANLIVSKEVDLVHVNEGFLTKLSGKFDAFVKQVRGVLDRRERMIYLDLSQSNNRQNFIKLHEAGHDLLPWQGTTLEFLDDDDTLDPSVNEQFEAEANYFASATLFQNDRFDSESAKLELGIKSVMYLSKRYGGSIHSTYRRYVENSSKSCCLLLLENISKKGDFPICEVRDYFQSPSFSRRFGSISWNPTLGFTWPFVKDYYFGRKMNCNGEISLPTQNGELKCNYQFFNSSYNGFVFIFPKGEKIKSRTTFVLNNL
ncbi:ImmA/IrrE family metallo-endopeptidase [Algoriphagus sp. Y33]|uniref:ImmA/IrrE family metallo-endopeptidase n=1 Tax=Algoriphagus sp. Y33 TaxID=2772483 RepID=UPI00177C0BED|nr:ImmA/IrrE family metallo-endopeptidase [Algoriphagus sp. Y33]